MRGIVGHLAPYAAAALLVAACHLAPEARHETASTAAPPGPVEITRPPPETPETTLPEPPDRTSELTPPREVPAPPELSYQEAARQILTVYPAGLRPLYAGARIPLLLYDLDQDGNQECLAAATSVQSPEEARRLSDPDRLFQDDAPRVPFFLLVFPNRGGRLQKPQALPLGEHLVFRSLRKLPLTRGRPLPLVVTAAFLMQEGEEIELFVFDGSSVLPRHHRSLVENMSNQALLEDIDGDGTIDLLLRERAMEEGTGFETFLSWQRWNGRAFVEYKTTNVVRNLNAFLQTARELMLAGANRDLLVFAVEPAEINRLRRRGLKDAQVLVQALGLGGSGLQNWPEALEVVLPEILEDPFSGEGTCRLTYRVVDSAGVPYIAAAQLRMLPNPFGEREFSFVAP
jgi:hypothetical protein